MAAPARYHHGDLRAALIARAAEVVVADGVGALSLRELARDLGVSHGAPSRHFPDKQALLDAVALDGFDRLRAALDSAVTPADDVLTFRQQFAEIAAAYVNFAVLNAPLLAIMFAAKHRAEAPDDVRLAVDRTFAGPLRMIEQAQLRGEVVGGEVEDIATAIMATMHGFAALIAAGLLHPDTSDAMLAATVDRLVDGLRPR
ncbi:MAG: TetR/AcrR family transcriptional regulator [Nakamurella sp.]